MATESTLDITVYLGPGDRDTLKKVIAFFAPKAEFAILESLIRTDFPDPKTTDIEPDDYPKGRVFCKDFELRWEKMDSDDSFRTVLVKTTGFDWEGEQLPDDFKESDTLAVEFSCGSGGAVDDYTVYLRPEKDTSLGRSLNYACIKDRPNKRNPNAKLHIRRYRDAWGRLIFWRYCKMEWE